MQNTPHVRGRIRNNVALSGITWFAVGGPAAMLFKPKDVQDLASFLKNKPQNIPHMAMGVGSNLLVRDGGYDGAVIRLGGVFAHVSVEGSTVTCGAGALDKNVALTAAEHGLTGLEFLVGIPGTIGGALAMNAGAYGSEIADRFVQARAVDGHGNMHTLTKEQMGFTYRHSTIPSDWIFTEATLKCELGDKVEINARMQHIMQEREKTQPVKTRTGGSTFKNPPNKKAWQLIDEAGMRGAKRGGAQVSELHCNFMMNIENATAADIEALGEEVREKVLKHSGVSLDWEIKRVGKEL